MGNIEKLPEAPQDKEPEVVIERSEADMNLDQMLEYAEENKLDDVASFVEKIKDERAIVRLASREERLKEIKTHGREWEIAA